jgi:hypothetical protein
MVICSPACDYLPQRPIHRDWFGGNMFVAPRLLRLDCLDMDFYNTGYQMVIHLIGDVKLYPFVDLVELCMYLPTAGLYACGVHAHLQCLSGNNTRESSPKHEDVPRQGW